LTLSPFPFTEDRTVQVAAANIPLDAEMTAHEAQLIWSKIFVKFFVNDVQTKTALAKTLLLYFAANGTSPQSDGAGELIVFGRKFKMREIFAVIGQRRRRFARIHADKVREYLEESPELANKLASRLGLSETYRALAFDFSDFCSDLTQNERLVISEMKTRILSTSAGYRENHLEIAQGIPTLPISVPPPLSNYSITGTGPQI